MNLYLRLLLTTLTALRGSRLQVGESLELPLRVLPSDLDINGHMNNARYLALVDLALMTLFIRSGFGKLCLQNRWRPMAGGAIIHYRRALGPFQRFTLRFTPVGWDEYWSYSRFEFLRDGVVCANGYTKGAAVGKHGMVPTSEFYAALGHHEASPPLPRDLAAWLSADALLGARAKRATPSRPELVN
jgi:acyl-CoA thioesterase FadM